MNRIAFKRGWPLFVCFVALFLFMKTIGQVQQFNFRILNGFFHILFITLAIRDYKSTYPELFNYLSGTAVGMMTSLVGVIPFAVFMIVYLNVDSEFMIYLQENIKGIGMYLTPFYSGVIILMEGLAVSLLLSYIITRMLSR